MLESKLWYSQLVSKMVGFIKTFDQYPHKFSFGLFFSSPVKSPKVNLNLKKNFMAPFYGWGSTASRPEPLRRGSLLFTTKFPEVPGTHFIDLGRMKG